MILSIQYDECLDWLISVLTVDLEEIGWRVEYFRSTDLLSIMERRIDDPLHYLLIFLPWHLSNKQMSLLNGPWSNRYYYWNLEQNVDGRLSQHFDLVADLDSFLNNSYRLIDYNSVNTRVWLNTKRKIFTRVPIPVAEFRKHLQNPTNDMIFTGCMNDNRRNTINKIEQSTGLKVDCFGDINPIYGDKLHELQSQYKYVLNIHHYSNAILERPRINEALSQGYHVISERPTEEDIDAVIEYDGLVSWIDEPWVEPDFSSKLPLLRLNYLSNLRFAFQPPKSPKVAVIQVNYGSYENQPQSLDHIYHKQLFSWFYLTDDRLEYPTEWTVLDPDVPMRDIPIRLNHARTKSRYFKYRPCELDFVQGYDYVIYMDGNVRISNPFFVREILHIIEGNPQSTHFSYKHYLRDNIYDERDVSVKLPKYKDEDLYGQVEQYHRHGHSYDLYECGIFMFKMCEQERSFFLDWYREFIYWGTQDQLCVDYCFRKHGIQPYILNDKGWTLGNIVGSIWLNKLFGRIEPHRVT